MICAMLTQPAFPTTTGRLAARKVLAGDIMLVTVEAPSHFRHLAGQYALLSGGGHPARPYSIASLPGEALSFHIRDSGHGLSHYLMHGASIGDPVTIAGPMGAMVPDLRVHKAATLIAGGTGFAPLWPIARQLVEAGATVRLVASNRTSRLAYMQPMLEQLEKEAGGLFTHDIVYDDADGLAHEYITADKRIQAAASTHTFFVSGPQPMVFACVRTLFAHGVPAARVLADYPLDGIIAP